MGVMLGLARRLIPSFHWLAGLSGGLLLCLCLVQAQEVVPTLTARVLDQTGSLNAAQRQQLEDRLRSIEQSHGTQIVLLLVPSTQPEDIASYANRVANSWRIGRREIGDGVLIVVAKNERKVRIEVAKALEGAIPDLAAKRIIDQAIAPHFKQGDFAGGLDAALVQLTARIKGEALPTPQTDVQGNAGGVDWMDLAIFVFFAVPLLSAVTRSIFGPKLGALLTGGAVGAIALTITANLLIASLAALLALVFALFASLKRSTAWSPGHSGGWRSGGSSGGNFGSHSGGFSSGGGGDFGGGGASGDW